MGTDVALTLFLLKYRRVATQLHILQRVTDKNNLLQSTTKEYTWIKQMLTKFLSKFCTCVQNNCNS